MTVQRVSLYAKMLTHFLVGGLRSKGKPTLKGHFLS